MSTLLLDKLLDPSSLVIVGASARPESPGYKLTENLIQSGYAGEVFLVNPRYRQVLNRPCYSSVDRLPAVPDLAILLAPSNKLKKALDDCAASGVKVALIMSGTPNPTELIAHARTLGIRVMGPDSAGYIRPSANLNATIGIDRVNKGALALISQSASLAAATLDWAVDSKVGFSVLMSTAVNADISLADCLDLLAEDRQTKAVIVYIDNVRNPRKLLSALSATARIKPVLLMRSSLASTSSCDAITRSGVVISNDDVFQAALSRTGVVRIRTFENLFAAAEILSSGSRIHGKRIAIISNGKAPAMMALEKLAGKGFDIPSLDLNAVKLPETSPTIAISGSNPLVLRPTRRPGEQTNMGDYYACLVRELQEQNLIDAIIVVCVPDLHVDATQVALKVIAAHSKRKPLIACWMGESGVRTAREAFSDASITTLETPEAAADALDFLHRYHVNQQQLLHIPNPASKKTRADVASARALVQDWLAAGIRVPGPVKTRLLLHLFDIDVLPAHRATSLSQALVAAGTVGYPVAMKLVSPNINYKSTVAHTQLDISNDEQLSAAWELICTRLTDLRPDAAFRGVLVEPMYSSDNYRELTISISNDATLGPFVSMGLGGDLTALSTQRLVQLPPLNTLLIKHMLQGHQMRIYFGAHRHKNAVNSEPVAQVLKRLSDLICELPEVFSLDINPLFVSNEGAVAVDAQIVLQTSRNRKRYQHLSIHPYPWEWIRQVMSKDGRKLQLRPIQPGDASALVKLVQDMSPESRYFRFMHAVNELTPLMVAQFTKIDYGRQMAFVATPAPLAQNTTDTVDEQPLLLGVSHYTMSKNRVSGEFAISVSDQVKGLGIGTALMELLIEHAQEQGLHYLHGDVLRNNSAMRSLMESLDFSASRSRDDPDVMIYTRPLRRENETSN